MTPRGRDIQRATPGVEERRDERTMPSALPCVRTTSVRAGALHCYRGVVGGQAVAVGELKW